MLLGSWEPSFDKKSRRIALPKKLRDYLATSEIVLSFGFESCIFGFDNKSWQKQTSQELSKPITDATARNTRRLLFSGAQIAVFDDQGRFIIPEDLKKYARIETPVVIGAGDHFEIWDKKIWQHYKKTLPK